MAEKLIQYPPGQPFPGTIGRTLETSTPAWPAPTRATRGRAQRHGDRPRRRRLRPALALRWPVRDAQPRPPGRAGPALQQLPHHRAVLAHPWLPAHRSQPPHARRCRPSPRCRSATPPTTASWASSTASSPRPCWPPATTRSPSASGTSRPPQETTAAGPFDRWPLGRGFERYYGFMGGDTDQWHPDLIDDNHSVRQPATPAGGLPPQRRPGRPRHRLHQGRPRRTRPTSPSSSGTPPAPATHPTRWSRSGSTATRATSTWGGTSTAASSSSGSSPSGLHAGRHRAVGPRPRRRAVGLAERRRQAHVHPADGGVRRRSSSQTDHHIGRVLDFIDALGELDNTHRRGRVRQRRQRRGRRARHPQRGAVLQPRPRDPGGQPRGHRRVGQRGHLQPLLVGLDVGRRHTVPPLEAGDLPGWHHRPVHRLVARRASPPGARCATSTPTPST